MSCTRRLATRPTSAVNGGMPLPLMTVAFLTSTEKTLRLVDRQRLVSLRIGALDLAARERIERRHDGHEVEADERRIGLGRGHGPVSISTTGVPQSVMLSPNARTSNSSS